MTASITLYNSASLDFLNATNMLLATGTFKVTLHTSASNAATLTNHVYADLNNELSTAFGYTAGGGTLASVTLGTVTTNDVMFDAADFVWTAAGGSIPAWRWAVIRRSDTVNSLVGPLIGFVLGDTTPADIPATTDGNTLTLQWNASGIVLGTV